jgi:S1-C subfamily serine protease
VTQQHPMPGRGDPTTLVKILAVLLLAVAGALVYTVIRQQRQAPRGETAYEPRIVTPAATKLGADEQSTIDVFKEVSGSVVHITSLATRSDSFSMDVTQIPQGTGTGFVWDTAGHVVTNFHVVSLGDRAQVTLQDGETYAARIVGSHPDKDIAVLQIDAPPSKLRKIAVGTSSDLQVGQKVLAIGNPFGLDQTLTTGVISGLGREIQSVTQRPITDVIQTDAAINPGNSGGPLLDATGRLIGINTAIYSPSGAYAGIGFAVPVDTVNAIVPQLISHGKVMRPGLGISTLSDHVAQRFGQDGVIIQRVSPNGAAAQAGLKGTRPSPDGHGWVLGDVIVALDDVPIHKMADLYKALDAHKVGDTVTVTVENQGERRSASVRLQAIP